METTALQLLVDKLTAELKEKNAMFEEATEQVFRINFLQKKTSRYE